jgi:MFS family permease
MITAIGAAMLCDKFGRRPLFLWCMGGMLTTFMCATVPLASSIAPSVSELTQFHPPFSAWAICGTLYGINPDNGAAGRAILGLIFIYYFARPLRRYCQSRRSLTCFPPTVLQFYNIAYVPTISWPTRPFSLT